MNMLRHSLLTLLFLVVTSFPVFAYKMTIYTDQTSKAKAEQVKQLFKTTYPFNQYNIDFEIVSATAAELNCAPDPAITRLVVCNSTHVTTDSAARGSDQAFIVRDLAQYGGSGGGVPVITTQSDPRMMLHEYLHTLGLSDEYEYSASEAPRFCTSTTRSPNLTVITPLASYASDAIARTTHSSAIPWYARIAGTTLITNSTNLGTGNVNSTTAAPNTGNAPLALSRAIGLYKGKTCRNLPATGSGPAAASWHPGGEPTIMEFLSGGLGGPTEQIVAGIYDSRGVTKRVAATTPPPPMPVTVTDGARDDSKGAIINVINNTGSSSSIGR